MRKLMIISIVLFAVSLFAQDTESFIELLRSDLKTEKVAIITEVMDFTEEESQVFWPLFRKYDFDLNKINDERIALIKDYAAHNDEMTDEKAKQLVNRSFKIAENKTKLRKKYFKEFDKVLSSTKVARFFQLERQIDLIVDLQIASNMPLVVKPSE